MTITFAALRVDELREESQHWSMYLSLVSDEKRTKAAAYKKKEDRVRTVLGEVLARSMLSDRLGMPMREMRFAPNAYGKPALAEDIGIHFNVAHSGDWVVCAVGDMPIGVDVEQMAPIDMSLVEPAFSSEEQTYLRAVPAEQRLDRFYELWTLKESYIKAVGKGLSIPLTAFTIVPERPIRCKLEEGAADCLLELYPLDSIHKLALCSFGAGAHLQEKVELWDEERLLNKLLQAKKRDGFRMVYQDQD
jgi:4'-phosphopantetheinyl transferase